jgi:O-antigen/teichoic acid export membrane protein
VVNTSALLRLFKNSNWNIIAFLIAAVVQFVTLPIVIGNIGIAQFGAAGIFLGALAPMMLVGAVIGQACTRDMSHQLASGQIMSARDTFWSSLWLCGGGSFILIVVFGFAGKFILRPFMGGEVMSDEVLSHLCLIAVVGWTAQQFFTVLQAGISSTQNYRLLAILNSGSAIFSAISLIVITNIWPSVEGFLFSTALGFSFALLLGLIFIRWKVPVLFPITAASRHSVGRILHFSQWQGVAQFVGSMSLQTDRFVLGFISTLSIVGQLNVAIRLQEVVYMGILKIAEVLFPYFSITDKSSDKEGISILAASSWFTNVLAAAALAPLVPLSASLIDLWVGANGLPLGATILSTLVTAGLIGSGANALVYFMLARGHSELLARVNIMHGITVITLSIGLLFLFGPIVSGVGILIANILRLIFFVWKMPNISDSGASITAMASKTQLPILTGLILAWLPWPQNFTGIFSWGSFMAIYLGSAFLITFFCIFLILLFREPRALLANVVRTVFARFFKAE